MTPRQVGIFISDGVEVLDFCGPFEVFSVAATRTGEHEEPLFSVATIAESIGMVTCTGACWCSRNTQSAASRRLTCW